MFSLAERKGFSVADQARDRAVLVLEVDTAFSEYEIELTPADARTFSTLAVNAGSAIDDKVRTLILAINAIMPAIDRGPEHPATGRSHHRFRIGRQVGKRILVLTLSKINFPPRYDFTELFEQLRGCAVAGDALCDIGSDEHFISARYFWL